MRNMMISSLAVAILALAACSSDAGPDNEAACASYASIISDWAIDGDGSDPSTTGVAIKIRTEAANLADDELADELRVVADAFEENSGDPTAAQVEAAQAVVSQCADLGVNIN